MPGGSLRGDFQALRDGISNIRKVGNVGPELWVKMAPWIRQSIRQEFALGVTPYGAKWKPLAASTVARGRHAPPLTDTMRLKGSLLVTPMGWTMSVRMLDKVAGLHQWGWRRRLPKPREMRKKGVVVAMRTHGTGGPKRQILPDGRIPNGWRQAIRKMARQLMAKKLGRSVTQGDMV